MPKGKVINTTIQKNFIPGSKSDHVSALNLPDPLARPSNIPTEMRTMIETIILPLSYVVPTYKSSPDFYTAVE
jgi:hypothetical protein|tara:strand:+ start:107 stop:325 length:219 start_codon:yes stop_codon:yes gene_type:complete